MYHEVDIIQNTYNFLISRQKYCFIDGKEKTRKRRGRESAAQDWMKKFSKLHCN